MYSNSNYLQVSKSHKLHYEVCGNQKGEPFLFVHGGPGFGYTDADKRFFNFDKQRVVFFDQRGASKSIPFGSIEENTTQDLVNDIITLLDYLQIDKVVLFGGSWGTTLSLVFAIQNPNRVKGLLLRGLFLGNRASIEYFLNGGVKDIYPKIWDRFKRAMPKNSRVPIANYYLDKMINGTKDERRHFAYEWAFYEISVYKKNITQSEVHNILSQIPFESLSVLEAHYMSNKCFIEEDYILNNLQTIQHIPTHIVHGREDAICPVEFAIQLNDKLGNSSLHIEVGGHSDSEPEIEMKLVELIKTSVW